MKGGRYWEGEEDRRCRGMWLGRGNMGAYMGGMHKLGGGKRMARNGRGGFGGGGRGRRVDEKVGSNEEGAGDEGEDGVNGMDERGMVRLKDTSETEVPE